MNAREKPANRRTPRLPPRVYRGKILHALNADQLEFHPDGGLLVNDAGTIEACEPWETLGSRANAFETVAIPPGMLITPGFTDLHVHLPQMGVTGCQDLDLLSWLADFVFPEEARFSDPAYAARVSHWFFEELLRNGITTAAVFLTSHAEATRIAFETAARLGNRVVMGQTLMDIHAPAPLIRPAGQLLAETEALCRQWHGFDGGRLQYAWTPRFALTSSEDLLLGLQQLCRQYPNVYLHTHLAEQPGEVAAVLRQFPHCADYTDVYAHYGLLKSRTILAHGIHLSTGELDRIGDAGSALAHCPSSNFFLKSGRFRLLEVHRRNIRLGLGSDVGAGPELSPFKVMKDAQYMQPDTILSPRTLFYLATLGGAEALYQSDRIGNFLPGREADFIILDPNAKSCIKSDDAAEPAIDPERCESDMPGMLDRLLSRLVYLGDDRLVKAVYIRGQKRYPPTLIYTS